MKIFRYALAGVVLATASLGAHAQQRPQVQGPRVVGLLEGYRCMALNIPDDQLMSWDRLPPIRAEPSAGSAQIGIASATVIVAEPRRETNGFIAVLHMDGRPGWLDARMVKPWVNVSNPSTVCHPAMMSNGRPGFTYTHRHG